MLWNKIKITVVMLCVMVLAGGGVGWLARPRVGVEIASADAAQPPAKKEQPPQATPADRDDNLKSEMKKIHASLDMLAEREAIHDGNEDITFARLQVIRLEEKLRLRELQWNYEREVLENRLKITVKEISRLEADLREMEAKTADPDLKKRCYQQFHSTRNSLMEQQDSLVKKAMEHSEALEPTRKELIRAEEKLRRLRSHRTEQREEYLARRQALQARIERLEDAALHLPAADRLRDVERKLDALRREVNELRTSLERAKER